MAVPERPTKEHQSLYATSVALWCSKQRWQCKRTVTDAGLQPHAAQNLQAGTHFGLPTQLGRTSIPCIAFHTWHGGLSNMNTWLGGASLQFCFETDWNSIRSKRGGGAAICI